MPRPLSLFSRLLLLTLPVEALVLALFGVALVRGAERREEATFDARLRIQREVIMGAIDLAPPGILRVDVEATARALAKGCRGCVVDGRGAILWESQTGWFAASGVRPMSEEVIEYLRTESVGGGRVRICGAAKRFPGTGNSPDSAGPLAEVILAEPVARLEASHREYRMKASAAGFTLLGFTALLLWLAIRVGLGPARRVVGRLHEVPGPVGLSRLDEGVVPKELRPLVKEINGLLDRLWGLVQAERRFTSDAAHELRTPLTLVKSTLQTSLLAGKSMEDHRRALHEALEDLGRLERTVESLLALARADAGPSVEAPSFRQVDLSDLLRSLAEGFSGAAEERGLDVILDLEPCVVLGEPEALNRLFANLAENAVKYAGAPGTITLRCSHEGPGASAAVEDTGPQVPPRERPSLLQRFFRGERGRTIGVTGSGLGLSIAEAMARLHGAQLTYEPTDGGGNRFAVRFPPRA